MGAKQIATDFLSVQLGLWLKKVRPGGTRLVGQGKSFENMMLARL